MEIVSDFIITKLPKAVNKKKKKKKKAISRTTNVK